MLQAFPPSITSFPLQNPARLPLAPPCPLPFEKKKVVTGAGFPEPRRVRLLLSEDFSHYLSAAGQKPLPLACAPSPSDATTSTAASAAAAAAAFAVLVGERTSATERRAPGSGSIVEKNASASEEATEGVLESDKADERGKGGGGPADKKMTPTLKVRPCVCLKAFLLFVEGYALSLPWRLYLTAVMA